MANRYQMPSDNKQISEITNKYQRADEGNI